MSKICLPLLIKPTLSPILKNKCWELVSRLPRANPQHQFEIIVDETPISLEQHERKTPWSKVTKARNNMLTKIDFDRYDYILWIDTDVVDYPIDLPTRLINANPNGIAGGYIFVEKMVDRFYDCGAYIEEGSDHIQPDVFKEIRGRNVFCVGQHFSKPVKGLVKMDCIGSVINIPTDVYKTGVKHTDHPAYTDWHAICKKAREMGKTVICDTDLMILHANLDPQLNLYPGNHWHTTNNI